MTILFIIMLLLTISYTIFTLRRAEKLQQQRAGTSAAAASAPDAEEEENAGKAASGSAKPVKKPRANVFEAVHSIITLLLILIGMMDLLGAIDFAQYHGAFALMGVTAAAEYLVFTFLQKRVSKTLRFLGKLFLTAAVLELTIFQFPSYSMMFGNYEEVTLSAADAVLEKGALSRNTDSGIPYVSDTGEVILEYPELEQRIGSVHVDYIEKKYLPRIQFKADITDDTTDTYRTDIINTTIVDGCDETNYISCQFSGTVHKLRVKVASFDEQQVIAVRGITLNAPIPFTVSAVRFLLIVGLGVLAYGIVHSTLLRRPYEQGMRFTRGCSIVMTCAAIALAAAIVLVKLPLANLSEQFSLEGGNQITQELVDAFENGQLSLLEEPAAGLLALENPYDRSARNDSGAHILWDHVLYEGKYYSYYGIAPVLLLFLPYHLITGYYFSTDLAVLLFSVMGLVFLTLTYLSAAKRWFRKVPVGCILAGLIVLLSVCGVWFSVGRPLFYEISISSGFAFVAMGAYFLISSNVVSQGKTSLLRILLASLFSGLAVLCRPTLAVYSICTCLFFLFGFRKSGQLTAADGTCTHSRKRSVGYILCALLPLMLLGLLQMWYNYARFGSPLDFGIQYSLTINDFTHAE